MRVAIPAAGSGADARFEQRFARCRFYAVGDSESGNMETVVNDAADAQGAGIKAARTMSRLGVEAVIVDDIGPKAFDALRATGIRLYKGISGTVGENLAALQRGELKELPGSTVPQHRS